MFAALFPVIELLLLLQLLLLLILLSLLFCSSWPESRRRSRVDGVAETLGRGAAWARVGPAP